jgi:hypothetical protein
MKTNFIRGEKLRVLLASGAVLLPFFLWFGLYMVLALGGHTASALILLLGGWGTMGAIELYKRRREWKKQTRTDLYRAVCIFACSIYLFFCERVLNWATQKLGAPRSV